MVACVEEDLDENTRLVVGKVMLRSMSFIVIPKAVSNTSKSCTCEDPQCVRCHGHISTGTETVNRERLRKARLEVRVIVVRASDHDLLHLGHQNPHVLGGDTAALVQRSVPARTSCVIADALLLPMLQLLRLLG